MRRRLIPVPEGALLSSDLGYPLNFEDDNQEGQDMDMSYEEDTADYDDLDNRNEEEVHLQPKAGTKERSEPTLDPGALAFFRYFQIRGNSMDSTYIIMAP